VNKLTKYFLKNTELNPEF